MLRPLTDQERTERDALIAEIHAAFADVSRAGGISWSESATIDNDEPDHICAAARLSDKDRHWHEVLDDPNWHPFPGLGGFSFIDAAGFLYYLPPTMIRMLLRSEDSEHFPGHFLGVVDRFATAHKLRPWSGPQLRAIARFISFMARCDVDAEHETSGNVWAKALTETWAAHLTD